MIWISHKSNGLPVFYSCSMNRDAMPGPWPSSKARTADICNIYKQIQYLSMGTISNLATRTQQLLLAEKAYLSLYNLKPIRFFSYWGCCTRTRKPYIFYRLEFLRGRYLWSSATNLPPDLGWVISPPHKSHLLYQTEKTASEGCEKWMRHVGKAPSTLPGHQWVPATCTFFTHPTNIYWAPTTC